MYSKKKLLATRCYPIICYKNPFLKKLSKTILKSKLFPNMPTLHWSRVTDLFPSPTTRIWKRAYTCINLQNFPFILFITCSVFKFKVGFSEPKSYMLSEACPMNARFFQWFCIVMWRTHTRKKLGFFLHKLVCSQENHVNM